LFKGAKSPHLSKRDSMQFKFFVEEEDYSNMSIGGHCY